MSVYEHVQWLQAMLLVTAGMLFFMTLLYLEAHPLEDEPGVPRCPMCFRRHPDDGRHSARPRAITYCPLHRVPRSECDAKHRES